VKFCQVLCFWKGKKRCGKVKQVNTAESSWSFLEDSNCSWITAWIQASIAVHPAERNFWLPQMRFAAGRVAAGFHQSERQVIRHRDIGESLGQDIWKEDGSSRVVLRLSSYLGVT
jgi:hypothetical protein